MIMDIYRVSGLRKPVSALDAIKCRNPEYKKTGFSKNTLH
jgi:hypothetical protein